MGALDDSRSSRWPLSWPAKEIFVQWLVKAWGAIPSAMIEYSYKKCGISNNGTDDTMFEDACRCMRPRSVMPTTRNHTWDNAAMPVPAAFFDSEDESDFEVF